MNVCFIPCRAGSKSVPRKNHLLIKGKPLFQLAIDQAIEANIFDLIIVSTNDEEILATSQLSDVTLLRRPEDLSTDESSTEIGVFHALKELQISDGSLSLLQCTSPLRKIGTVIKGFDLIDTHPDSTIIGVRQVQDSHPARIYKLTRDGYLESFVPLEEKNRRQDLSLAYHRNGSFYGTRISRLLNEESLISKKVIPLICDERESVNIDTPIDYEFAKLLTEG
jgi:CMP-N-acetylneuraminic acid synthetase